MITVIKFILVAVGIWYISKFIFRLVLPFALRKFTEKLMKKAAQQGGAAYTNGNGSTFHYQTYTNTSSKQSRRDDGKVQVDFVPPKKDKSIPKVSNNAGEFVDFEEIK